MRHLFSLALFLFTQIVHADDMQGFIFKDEAINPACVALFNSSEADQPYIHSIILNNCQHSNVAFQNILKDDDDNYYFYNNGKNVDEGRYSYKVIGKSKNGIYILSTHSSGGGTLDASDLLFIRLNKTHQYVFENAQPKINDVTEMQLLGYVVGGDRCLGDFVDVNIKDNQVNIKQHHGDQPIDCSKTRDFSINLEHL